MTDTEPDDDESRENVVLASHIIQLAEHFDTVQIIVTKHEADNDRTYKGSRGHGNWYANYGAVKEWVTEQEERTRENQRHDSE